MKVQRYGWLPDLPDIRDFKYVPHPRVMAVLPPKADMRLAMPPVYNQGELGSCTGNSSAGAMQYERRVQKLQDYVPSRLFIYYNERVLEGTVGSDAGAMIRDAVKTLAAQGAPDETLWPYDIAQFTTKPSDAAYSSGKADLALKYQRIDNTRADHLKASIASGFPIIFGFSVYESFESEAVAQSGVVPMPQASERLLGGHAVLAVGYDDEKSVFVVRNSWGDAWGDKGYFYMPYAYITNPDLASDFWNIELVGAQ